MRGEKSLCSRAETHGKAARVHGESLIDVTGKGATSLLMC